MITSNRRAMEFTAVISPEQLAEAGYVHTDQITDEYLAERGYFALQRLRNERLSLHKAARLLGISDQTLKSYASEGLIAADADLHFYLHDVIRFDCRAAKRRMRMKRTAVRGKFFF